MDDTEIRLKIEDQIWNAIPDRDEREEAVERLFKVYKRRCR